MYKFSNDCLSSDIYMSQLYSWNGDLGWCNLSCCHSHDLENLINWKILKDAYIRNLESQELRGSVGHCKDIPSHQVPYELPQVMCTLVKLLAVKHSRDSLLWSALLLSFFATIPISLIIYCLCHQGVYGCAASCFLLVAML